MRLTLPMLVRVRPAYVLLAVLALANSGCLLVAAGAAGGTAVCYAYLKGKVCLTYNATPDDTWAAMRTALTDLGLPIFEAEYDGVHGKLESRTTDGDAIKIHLDTIPSRIPAEGLLSRVCVRVATFGDQQVSACILDQIGAHLAPPSLSVVTGPPPLADVPPPALPAPAPPEGTAPETPPPPALLPPEPVPPQGSPQQ